MKPQPLLLHRTLLQGLLLTLLLCFAPLLARGEDIYKTDFEGFTTIKPGGWSISNGVWGFGKPTNVGPAKAHQGTTCAGTVLDGNYGEWKDSRLITPKIPLPSIGAGEQLSLKFWQWFSYAGSNGYSEGPSYGVVEISTDKTKWVEAGSWYTGGSNGWQYVGTNFSRVDLSAYAGKTIYIAFHHVGLRYAAAGWYIDEMKVVKEPTASYAMNTSVSFEGFTAEDWQGWSADNGVWNVGKPKVGPQTAHEGTQVAGTILDGGYPEWRGSGLISPPITLPAVKATEQLSLKFWEWFSYAGSNGYSEGPSYGRVYVSVWNDTKKTWDNWIPVSTQYQGGSSGWRFSGTHFSSIDLTPYKNKKVRINFGHQGLRYSASGWYIDEVEVVKEPIKTLSPNRLVRFEGFTAEDWQGWSADNGVWEVGKPTLGPGKTIDGLQCAGTILDGNYPEWRGSGLISPSITLPQVASGQEITLGFLQWFSYAGSNGYSEGPSNGRVYVSVWNDTKKTWDDWQAVGESYTGDSAKWFLTDIPLTAYAGKKIRLDFYHSGLRYSASGWYVDFISVQLPAPVITSFDPPKGVVRTPVTIKGSGFTAASSVKFNGVKGEIVQRLGDTEITAKVPEGATTGRITVTTLSGVGTSDKDFEVPTAPALVSLSIDGNMTYPGLQVTGKVTLSSPATTNGVVVNLGTNNASVLAPDSTSVTVPEGSTSATFTATAGDVLVDTTVALSATLDSVTKTADVTVKPWDFTLTASPNSVVGGKENSTGILSLIVKAPAGKATVTLTSSNPAALSVDSSFNIAGGKKSGIFKMTSHAVKKATKVTITATFKGVSKSVVITVNPVPIGTLVFYPSTVVGGDNTTGVLTLNENVTSDTTVTITSSDSGIAMPDATATILAGSNTVSFNVDTMPVTVRKTITITVTTADGQKIIGKFIVTP